MAKRSASTTLLVMVAVVVSQAVVSCAGVEGRPGVTTVSGRTLDCPDDLVAWGGIDILPDAVGFDTPDVAVETFQELESLPSGTFTTEPPPPGSGTAATYVLTDGSGNRIARLDLRHTARGWFIAGVEHCGTLYVGG